MHISSTASRLLAVVIDRPARAADTLNAEVLALYDQYRQPLFRYLLTFGLVALDCEEIIQDVFLALLRHLLEARPNHNLKAWLFRVAHNQALKLRGHHARCVDLSAVVEQFDDALNPEQRLLQSRQQSRLCSVVAALAENDRQCLALRVEGLRYREIADVLGISLGSVANSLKRSLSKLAEVYER